MVNDHYKVIDFREISFFDIEARTYCIPINPVNTQDENRVMQNVHPYKRAVSTV